MTKNTQRYRNHDIVRLPRSMTHLDGRPYVVRTWDGRKLSKHTCLRDAKAEIDRIMKGSDRTDGSEYGFPF
ncbi:MAG: hypothetical protein EBR82_73545 [Caulobacteraceae bacterium]|nr:hypothetical protein [Caulobacteraceae bacterium]